MTDKMNTEAVLRTEFDQLSQLDKLGQLEKAFRAEMQARRGAIKSPEELAAFNKAVEAQIIEIKSLRFTKDPEALANKLATSEGMAAELSKAVQGAGERFKTAEQVSIQQAEQAKAGPASTENGTTKSALGWGSTILTGVSAVAGIVSFIPVATPIALPIAIAAGVCAGGCEMAKNSKHVVGGEGDTMGFSWGALSAGLSAIPVLGAASKGLGLVKTSAIVAAEAGGAAAGTMDMNVKVAKGMSGWAWNSLRSLFGFGDDAATLAAKAVATGGETIGIAQGQALAAQKMALDYLGKTGAVAHNIGAEARPAILEFIKSGVLPSGLSAEAQAVADQAIKFYKVSDPIRGVGALNAMAFSEVKVNGGGLVLDTLLAPSETPDKKPAQQPRATVAMN